MIEFVIIIIIIIIIIIAVILITINWLLNMGYQGTVNAALKI